MLPIKILVASLSSPLDCDVVDNFLSDFDCDALSSGLVLTGERFDILCVCGVNVSPIRPDGERFRFEAIELDMISR